MRLMAFGATDHGRRRVQNQDNVLCYTSCANSTPVGLYAVADGMGGQNAGEVASQITIDIIRQDLSSFIDQSVATSPPDAGDVVTARLSEDEPALDGPSLSMADALTGAIERSNQTIRDYGAANPDAAGLGSTLTLAMVMGDLALVGNIGDSRTYLVRDGVISRLTEDHSLVSSLVRQGLISDDEVYSHPQRNLVYQALGTKPDITPDIFMQRLQPADILILCSDGLWEMVRDEEIRRIVEAVEDPEEAATSLVNLANANGGVDNISVVVIRVA